MRLGFGHLGDGVKAIILLVAMSWRARMWCRMPPITRSLPRIANIRAVTATSH